MVDSVDNVCVGCNSSRYFCCTVLYSGQSACIFNPQLPEMGGYSLYS